MISTPLKNRPVLMPVPVPKSNFLVIEPSTFWVKVAQVLYMSTAVEPATM